VRRHVEAEASIGQMVVRVATLAMLCGLTAAPRAATAQNSPDDAACQPPRAPQGDRVLPASLDLAAAGEPGERLELTLRLRTPQGRPVQGPVVYVYHADASGEYRRAPDASGCFRFHGVLHGWARPNADGVVLVRSIRPGPYPRSTEPAHVHIVVQFPGQRGFYLNDLLFDDDPRLTPAVRAAQTMAGGPGVVHATRNHRGVWQAERVVTLQPPGTR
jgi:protocatechuate 3,4-dioxygenase, beta subunit